MDQIRNKIVDYLNRNRVSTTEVADALGKCGVVDSVYAINRGYYRAGVIKWVYAYNESNWSVHEQIQNVEENKIIFVDVKDCNNRAIFGELVSKYLLLYRQSKAIVINGKMRDAAALIRENWPIWCTGFTPVGCYNALPQREVDYEWKVESKKKYDGAIAVCDDCGVVVIPKEKISEEFYEDLVNIESQEDIWFDRLDRYKETTYEIVCKKNYLNIGESKV